MKSTNDKYHKSSKEIVISAGDLNLLQNQMNNMGCRIIIVPLRYLDKQDNIKSYIVTEDLIKEAR